MSDIVRQAEALLAGGRPTDALALLQREGRKGNGDALFHEAMWTLIGHPVPRDVPRARALLRAARTARHDEAAMIEVALTANGSGGAPDWAGAMALLRELARYSPVAAAQLALLERMDIDDAGAPRVRPQTAQICTAPDVWHVSSLLTPDECRHVAEAVLDILAPATVIDPRTGQAIANPIRTSHGAVIGPLRETLVIQALNRRIAAASDTDWRQGEALSVLRYEQGQQFRPHLDTINGARNQRVKTVLVYLNEGFDGGGTSFVANGLTIKPRIGDTIVFDNIRADGAVEARAQHAGEVVTRGVKWLATRWIRARAFDPWTGPEAA